MRFIKFSGILVYNQITLYQSEPEDHRVKINQSKKRDKFLDLARELKKLRNMSVSVILIVKSVLGMRYPKIWKGDRNNWKLEEELRPSRLQHWIGLNIEKGLGDLRRLKLVRKTNNQ